MTTSATLRAALMELQTLASVIGATPGWASVAAADPVMSSQPTNANLMPRTFTTAGARASASVAPAPVCLIPAWSRYATVDSTPALPASVMWFEPSVTTFNPPFPASSVTARGSTANTMPVLCWTASLTTGHSKSFALTSLSEMRAATEPFVFLRAIIGAGQPRSVVLNPPYWAVPPWRTQSQPFFTVFAMYETPRSGHVSPVEMRVRTAAAE